MEELFHVTDQKYKEKEIINEIIDMVLNLAAHILNLEWYRED